MKKNVLIAGILAVTINVLAIILALVSTRGPDLTVPIHPVVRLAVLISTAGMTAIGLMDAEINHNSPMFSLSVAFANIITCLLWIFSPDFIGSAEVLVMSTTLNIFFLMSVWSSPMMKGKENEDT